MRAHFALALLAGVGCGPARGAPASGSASTSAKPVAAAPVDAAATAERFRTWIVDRARAEGLVLDAWWSDDLDGDGVVERVAKLCRPDDNFTAWYAVETGSARFAVEHSSWGFTSVCPYEPDPPQSLDALPAWETRAAGTIFLAQSGKRGDLDERHLAIRDGALVVVVDVDGGADAPYGYAGNEHILVTETDWDRGARFTRREPLGHQEFWGRDEAAAIIPIRAAGAAGAARTETWTEVIDGRGHWRGPEDASLAVRAERWKRGIAVTIEVTDDRPMALAEMDAPSDGAGSEGDVLGVWWCVPGPDEPCAGPDAEPPHHMLIGVDADGTVQRDWWAHASRASLDDAPVVRRLGGGAFEIDFELAPDVRRVRFAVELHDRDGGADGSTVATARVHHNDLESLGALIALDGDGRWPRVGRRLADGDPIIAPEEIE